MLNTYYSILDVSNKYLFKSIYKSKKRLIKSIELSFVFSDSSIQSGSNDFDLVSAFLHSCFFSANPRLSLKQVRDKDDFVQTSIQKIVIFNQKDIQNLLSDIFLSGIFKVVLKNSTLSTNSILYFEVSFESKDMNNIFPEAFMKKINYEPPRINLMIQFNKNLIQYYKNHCPFWEQ